MTETTNQTIRFYFDFCSLFGVSIQEFLDDAWTVVARNGEFHV